MIVIGMHRSGTSLVVRLLDRMGMHTGWRRDRHDEALLFQRLNVWMLRQAGGAWDRPGAIRDLVEDDRTRSLVTDYLDLTLGSPRALSFLGIPRYLRLRDVRALREPWGWKDPRNTFTLPLWLDVFPGAKVVHVIRHGVDVARSLVRRRNRMLDAGADRYRRRRPVYRLLPKRGGFSHSVRCRSVEAGLGLWEEYVTEARRHVDALEDRAVEVRYESLLREPRESLLRLAAACGLPVTGGVPEGILDPVDASRAYAHRGDADARAFAEDVSGRLARFGY